MNYVRQSWGNHSPATAEPGEVGLLRPHTFTAMSIGPDGHCPTVVQPELAAAISDPKLGITEALRSMTLPTLLTTADHLVSQLKTAAPGVKPDDIVNGLTIAYCPIVEQDKAVPPSLKVAMLDHFSERVYTELRNNGKN